MFYVVGTKSLDSNAIDFTETGINFIGRTFYNNGIQGKIKKRDFEPNEPNTITATVIGNYKYVKYQKEPYYCSQNINKLTPKKIINKWNDFIAYFFIANIQKFVSLYDGQQGGYKLDDIKNHKIQLPTKNGEIDFDFMDGFVAELEAQRVAELEAYLTVTGLKDYVLTKEEEKAIQDYLNIDWKEYSIGDLFFVATYKKRFDANKVAIKEYGEHPYIVRTSVNNGCRGFLDEDKVFLNDGNTISFGQDTATVFYQEKPYFTGDKIKILKCKFDCFEKSNAQFFITAISRSFSSFTWGSSSYGIDVIEAQKIQLPIKNGEIDFDFMETLTKAIQKLVIKDVAEWADKKISATKQVIKN